MSRDSEYNYLSGDAGLVAQKAEQYGEIGRAIARSVTTLNAIVKADEQKSQAISKLRDGAEDVAREIALAQKRYSLTAEALGGYASSLGAAQTSASDAIRAISVAETELASAQRAQTRAADAAEIPGEDQAQHKRLANNAEDLVHERAGDVAVAEGLWRAARTAKENAAGTAERSIDDAVNGKVGDKLNDNLWDNMTFILDAVKVVCQIAGVLAIFLSWVPILGAVLIGLAILGAVITLVDSVVKLTRGQASWGDVAFAAAGVLLAAFGGKLVAHLAKIAKFKSLAQLASPKPGAVGFMSSKAFKSISGISKATVKQEMKSLTKWSTILKQTFKSPFASNLGTGTKFTEKLLNGAKVGWHDAVHNPFGFKSLEAGMPGFDQLSNSAKVMLVVLDSRTGLSKLQTATNGLISGADVSMKPESLLHDAVNYIENSVRR